MAAGTRRSSKLRCIWDTAWSCCSNSERSAMQINIMVCFRLPLPLRPRHLDQDKTSWPCKVPAEPAVDPSLCHTRSRIHKGLMPPAENLCRVLIGDHNSQWNTHRITETIRTAAEIFVLAIHPRKIPSHAAVASRLWMPCQVPSMHHDAKCPGCTSESDSACLRQHPRTQQAGPQHCIRANQTGQQNYLGRQANWPCVFVSLPHMHCACPAKR